MAIQIPTIDGPRVQQRALGAPQVRAQPVDTSAFDLGQQALGAAGKIFQKSIEDADTAAVLAADEQLTRWQQQAFYNPETGVYSRKGQNALNITNETMESFEKTAGGISDTLNPRQRARFNELVSRKRQGINADLNQWEYRQREQYYNDVDRGQIETSMQGAALAYNRPADVAGYKAKINAVLASQARRNGLSEETLQANMLAAGSSVESSVIGRMVADNPYAARDYFQTAQAGMTAEDQVRASNLIERGIKSREIEARQAQAIYRGELTSTVQDASAAYLQGLEYANPPTRAQFLQAYGDEEGSERYASFERLQGASASIKELATATPEERLAILQQYQPAEGGVATEGYRERAQLYGVVANAASGLFKRQQEDPAAYVATYSPAVRAAAEEMDAGGSAETYAAAVLAEQERLGVLNPKLLSNAQASSIAAQFASTADGGANSARLISSLQEQWGKNWPLVFKQLQNDLPGSAMMIGTGLDENTASRLARISPLKDEELKRGLDTAEVKSARDTLNVELAEFRNTLAGQVGGDRTFATMYKEAERLALSYMGEGVSARDAASRAVKSFVNDRYSVRGTWRAPISLDADMIERGAELTQEAIDPGQLQFTVPPGVSEEFARDRVRAAIQKDGQWVTLPDESGLALYYGGEAVLDREGLPITRSWEELTGLAADTPTAFQRFNQGRRALRDASQGGGQ